MNEWNVLSQNSISDMMGIANNFGDSAMDLHRGLAKALSSGSSIDTTYTDSSGTSIVALRLEDLNGVLTTLTYSMKQLKLWPWIKKGSAFNVLYQYNTLDSLGNRRVSPFYQEAGKPIEQDESFTRNTREIRFLGLEKEITLIATLQKLGTLGGQNIETVSVKNGTTQLMRQLEDVMFYGREELDDTDLAFDGIEKQILDDAPDDNIIDCEGAALTPGYLDDAASILHKNYSNMTDLAVFLSTDAMTNFSKPYRVTGANSMQRHYITEKKGKVIIAGSKVDGYESQYAFLPFMPSVFMNEVREDEKMSNFSSALGTSYPAAPASLTVTPVSDSTSKMSADTYYYGVVAKNRTGIGTPVYTTTGTACLASQRLDLAWGAPASGTVNSYMLFRSTYDLSVAANWKYAKLMREVAPSPRTYSDKNQWRPGTSVSFVLDGEFENLAAAQLAPFMRYDLARLTTAQRYCLLLFIDVVVKNAKRMILFKNVGTD